MNAGASTQPDGARTVPNRRLWVPLSTTYQAPSANLF